MSSAAAARGPVCPDSRLWGVGPFVRTSVGGVFTVYSLQFTVYSLQFTVYSLQFTVYSLLQALRFCYLLSVTSLQSKHPTV